jgi:hypothetical protein
MAAEDVRSSMTLITSHLEQAAKRQDYLQKLPLRAHRLQIQCTLTNKQLCEHKETASALLAFIESVSNQADRQDQVPALCAEIKRRFELVAQAGQDARSFVKIDFRTQLDPKLKQRVARSCSSLI